MRLAGILAFIWGAVLALFLQKTRLGAFLADKRTWVTVVAGVGVDLLIARRVLGWKQLGQVIAVFTVSSVPVITRSLLNENSSHQEIIDAIIKTPGQ
jgi:hypothetical protein